MTVALGIFIASSVGCWWASDFLLLLICRLGQGLSSGGGSVTAKALVRDLFSGEDAVRIFGHLTSAVFLGPMIAPVLGGLVIRIAGWRDIYAFLAGWSTVCLLVVLLALVESLPPEKRASTGSTPWASFRPLFGRRSYRRNLTIIAATAGGMFAFVTGSAELFISRRGLSATQFGFVFLLVAAGFVAGVKVNSTLTHWSTQNRFRLGAWSCAVGGAMLALTDLIAAEGRYDLVLIIICCATFYFGLGVVQPLAIGRALEPFSNLAGAASAWLGFVMMGAGAVVSAVVGRLHSKTEIAIAIFFLTAGVLSLLLARDSEGKRLEASTPDS
jgi:DHA1 family bicyclomycin/chloramphenicol resistance-like MFS transporter